MDIAQVMQAAERLRRLNAGESYVSVYGDEMREWKPKIHHLDIADAGTDTLEPRDRETVAEWALSILPKGKRPEAMEQPEQCCARRSMFDEDANRISAWGFDTDDGEVFRANCHCLSCWTKGTFRVQFYRTEEEALLARRWHHLTT